MVKIGLISDVHSNWEALSVALDTLKSEEEVDELFFSGDLIGYGPDPNRCVGAVREASAVAVKGNHDAGLVGDLDIGFFNQWGIDAINWTRDNITDSHFRFIADLPETRFFSDKRISLLHGSSVDPLTKYILRKVDAYNSYQATDDDFFLQAYGHTHMPAVYEIEKDDVNEQRMFNPGEFELDGNRHYLVNPGSVGQPRDGNWKTSFAVLDVGEDGLPERVRFFREEYDAEGTRGKISDAGLPKELGDRLLTGR
ncbi:MAG: metallophosphoesterase family protein [Candidatus Acetothermia bacterium]